MAESVQFTSNIMEQLMQKHDSNRYFKFFDIKMQFAKFSWIDLWLEDHFHELSLSLSISLSLSLSLSPF